MSTKVRTQVQIERRQYQRLKRLAHEHGKRLCGKRAPPCSAPVGTSKASATWPGSMTPTSTGAAADRVIVA